MSAARQAVRHLTPAELADRLQVSVATLAEWRKNGTGPDFLRAVDSTTNNTIRYRLADVEAWEQARLASSTAR